MESELKGIPLGYKFVPSHEQLTEYLRLKVTGGDKFPYDNVITERDIYNPEELQGIFEGAKSKHKVYYFFTKLKKKSKRGSNIDRTVGKGTWKGQQKNKNGRQRSFCYENRGSKEHHKWTMIEYYLPPEIYQTDYVVCRITNKKPKDDHQLSIGGEIDDAAVHQQNHQQHVHPLAPSPNNDDGLLLIDEYLQNERNYNSSSNQIMTLTHDQQIIEGNNEMQWYMNNIDFGAEPQETYTTATPESSLLFGASSIGYGDQIFDGNNHHLENPSDNPMVLDTNLWTNECYNTRNNLQNPGMDNIWATSSAAAESDRECQQQEIQSVFEGDDEWSELNQLLYEDPILNQQLVY